MTRVLSVSEIRNEMYMAAGGSKGAGDGEPSLPLLGTLFHSIFSALTGADGILNLIRPLERADSSLHGWQEQLILHAYSWHVAPSLQQHEAVLQGRGECVRSFWKAIENLAGWLAGIMWEQRMAGRGLHEARAALFEGTEREVSIELTDPEWSDVVRIEGRLDALLRQPSSGTPCIVEVKLGRSAPAADLCQAALYHLMLGDDSPSLAELAVVSFSPALKEQRFASDQLLEAQEKLKQLAAALAGVNRKDQLEPSSEPEELRLPGVAPSITRLGKQLVEAFRECGTVISLDGEPLAGPSFIRFFVDTEAGMTVAKLQSLCQAVWLRLATEQPPMASMQRGRVAIDIERPDRRTVLWRYRRGEMPKLAGGSSRFPVGVAIDGALVWADFARPENSHFLVAGTNGSGKSEWLRSTIASLIAQNTPGTLQLILIDPKRTAFHDFEGSPFLRQPVVYPDDIDVHEILLGLIVEMEERYRMLAEAGASDLQTFVLRGGEVPRIVCVCDEFGDLLAAPAAKERRELENTIGRLASKGRAAGIHLVFATQRPSRDVVTGRISANLVARVCLRVVNPMNSRIILDEPGGAALLGRGDLLFKDIGAAVRLQSPYLTTEDLAALLAE